MTPMITILMPAFNVAGYIRESIQSVLQQSLAGFELLVIDDGSTDNTIEVIHGFSDARIRVIRQNHLGIARTLNHGLYEARGEYIARFDADDICLPGRLAKQFHFLQSNPDHVICGGNAEYIAANGEHLFNFKCRGYTHEAIISQLYDNCPFIHSAVMYRKAAVIEAGGYPADAHNFEDYLLWRKLAGAGKFANLQDQLIRVRFNPLSVTIDEKWRGERFRQLKKKIIRQGFVTSNEESELAAIIQRQDLKKVKEGAYYALCGKKFLVDNHQPSRARSHLSKAISIYPLRWDNYALYLLSFFPQSFIGWLHRNRRHQTLNA